MEEPSFVRCVKGTVDEDVQLLHGEREGSVHGSHTSHIHAHTFVISSPSGFTQMPGGGEL